MAWWIVALVFVGTTIISALLQRRPKDVQPSSLGDFNFPTAQEGRVIPYAAGTVKIAGPNVVWYGDLTIDPIKKKSGGFFGLFAKNVTVGYKYYVGMHLALCHGAVELLQILTDGDKDVPFSSATVTVGAEEDFRRLTVDQPELFGGEEREGGLAGTIDFYRGLSTSVGNAYLAEQLGLTEAPAYQDLCHAVFRSFYVGTSQYIKPLAFVVRRLPSSFDLDAAVTNINGDANPAEVIYELLRSQPVGLGRPPARFHNASFIAAAEQLAAENMGISIQLDDPAQADQVIQDICRHIDAVCYTDPQTGEWTLELVRLDYVLDDLLHLTEQDLLVPPEFTRGSWEDTLNEVKIEYIDREQNFERSTAQAHESANHAIRGGEISGDVIPFLGISSRHLAQRIAARELKAHSYPLAKWLLRCKRGAQPLRWGRPFRLSFAPLCIAGMVLRVTSINWGRLEQGEIEIEAVEDIFAIAFTAYGAPAASNWQNPIGGAQAPTAQLAMEAPYHISQGERALLVAAVRADGTSLGFEVWTDEGGGFFHSNTHEQFAPSGLLADPYPRTTAALDTTGFVVETGRDLARLLSTDAAGRVRGDNLLLIGSEIMSWQTVTDNMDGTVTISGVVRGVFDTLPADHALGARVWFLSDGSVPSRDDPYPADLSGDIKCLPFNPRGTVAIGAVSAVPFALDSRAAKPYPPGKVRVNNNFWPDGATYQGSAELTWAHRNRLAQFDVVQQDADSVAGGQEGDYTVEVLLDGVVEAGRTETAITGSSFTYTHAQYLEDDPTETKAIQFRITPVNGALEGQARTTDEFFLEATP